MPEQDCYAWDRGDETSGRLEINGSLEGCAIGAKLS